MKIAEAIEQADALYPNSYTRAEKLGWAYELTAMVAEKYKKQYGSLVLHGSAIELPPSILEEDIEGLYVDGVWYDKVDARSFDTLQEQDAEVKVIYKLRPAPYAEPVFTGSYPVQGNRIQIPDTAFSVGDCLRITQGQTEAEYSIMEAQDDTYWMKEDFPFQGDTALTIQVLVTANTPMPAPYDSMYVDFLLGRIAYYQNDYEEQNKHMAQFNAKLTDYAYWYKQTNPIKTGITFRSMW